MSYLTRYAEVITVTVVDWICAVIVITPVLLCLLMFTRDVIKCQRRHAKTRRVDAEIRAKQDERNRREADVEFWRMRAGNGDSPIERLVARYYLAEMHGIYFDDFPDDDFMPHGNVMRYTYGCRCQRCTKAQRELMKSLDDRRTSVDVATSPTT